MKTYLLGLLLLFSVSVDARQSTIVGTESNVSPLGTTGEVTATVTESKRRLDVNPSDYFSEVAKGNIAKHSIVSFNGHKSAITTAAITLWEEAASYVFPAAATIMKVSSTDADDTSAGAGAKTVLVEGLLAGFIPASEVVILSGQTEVNTVNLYLRINTVTVATAGASLTNEGIVYVGTGTVTAGVPDTVFSRVNVGEGLSHIGVYTIPADFTATVIGAILSSEGNKVVNIELFIRPDGGAFILPASLDLFNGSINISTPFGLLAEKTDIDVRGTVSTSTADARSLITLLLVDGS